MVRQHDYLPAGCADLVEYRPPLRLVEQLPPFRSSTCVVRQQDRNISTDAFTKFALDAQGRTTSIKLNNIAGNDNDSRDLDLKRIE